MKSNWTVDADLNARLTLTIEQSEYSDAVEKQLADYRKKARIPGFRPGTAPMTLIRKQYQEPLRLTRLTNAFRMSFMPTSSAKKLKFWASHCPFRAALTSVRTRIPLSLTWVLLQS